MLLRLNNDTKINFSELHIQKTYWEFSAHEHVQCNLLIISYGNDPLWKCLIANYFLFILIENYGSSINYLFTMHWIYFYQVILVCEIMFRTQTQWVTYPFTLLGYFLPLKPFHRQHIKNTDLLHISPQVNEEISDSALPQVISLSIWLPKHAEMHKDIDELWFTFN